MEAMEGEGKADVECVVKIQTRRRIKDVGIILPTLRVSRLMKMRIDGREL